MPAKTYPEGVTPSAFTVWNSVGNPLFSFVKFAEPFDDHNPNPDPPENTWPFGATTIDKRYGKKIAGGVSVVNRTYWRHGARTVSSRMGFLPTVSTSKPSMNQPASVPANTVPSFPIAIQLARRKG